MFIIFLGLIDAIGGAILALTVSGFLGVSDFIFYLAVLFFLKGAWSILTAAAAGFYFDIMGIADVAGSVCLLLTGFNVLFGFFIWIGIILVLKGMLSMAFDLPMS